MWRGLFLLALAGCAHATAPPPAKNEPLLVEESRAEEDVTEAPPDTAVIARDGGCWMVGDQRVQCPATIVAPEPAEIAHGTQSIAFDPHTFKCTTEGRVEPCPDALLPRLADGVAPSRQNGEDCALGNVRVACP